MPKKRVIDFNQPDKFREAILYIAEKCLTDPKFSMTKLNKILFYADFIHFAKTGKSITNQKYQKLNWGPAPRGMKPVSDSMQEEGELEIVSRPYHGRTQKKPIALREAQLDAFISSEISIIDEVIKEAWDLSASQISEASHGFVGWQIVELKETIPYGLAWIDEESELTEEEVEATLEMQPLSEETKSSLRGP